MTNTVDFNHEMLFERLPAGHVTRLRQEWGHRRQLEAWARREKVGGAVLEAVERLIAPCRATVN